MERTFLPNKVPSLRNLKGQGRLLSCPSTMAPSPAGIEDAVGNHEGAEEAGSEAKFFPVS